MLQEVYHIQEGVYITRRCLNKMIIGLCDKKCTTRRYILQEGKPKEGVYVTRRLCNYYKKV